MRPTAAVAGHLLCSFLLASVIAFAQTEIPKPPPPQPPEQECKAGDQACLIKKVEDAANKAHEAAAAAEVARKNAEEATKNLKAATDRAETSKAQKAATSAGASAQNAETSARKATQSEKAATGSAALQNLLRRKAAASKRPLDDYVPCLFDEVDDFDLRALANPYQITDTKDKEIKQALIARGNQIQTQVRSSENPNDKALAMEWQGVMDNLGSVSLTGLSREGAKQQLNDLTRSASPNVSQSLQDANVATKAATKAAQDAVQTVQQDALQLVQNATSPQTFDRPPDVSCSFSVLAWHETSDVFGRRVANDYVAIQVNIRNLNKDTEFLIHDIQIAVDTGLSPRQFGRFQAGRDKLIVRAVAQRGQSEDRRNLIINTLQMLGNIAGGASAAFTQVTASDVDTTAADKLSTAVALFQGPFITGLINIFPDHTLEHINHISDLVFSASSTNKTIIPIQGSVPLVTFLTEKPLEQLPFSRCGTVIKPTFRRDRLDIRYKQQRDNNADKDPGSVNYGFCKLDPEPIGDSDGPEPDAYTKPLHYKKWHSAALEILQRRIYVVVAGVHIQELSNGLTVDTINCPPAVLAGNTIVNLSAVDSGGNVSCTLTGSQLGTASSASLVLGTQSTVSAGIQPAADGNSATLTFKASDFNGVTGNFELFVKDSSGNNTDTKKTIAFGVRIPNVTSVTYSSTPIDTTAALTATLIGTNLDRINGILLTDDVITSPLPATMPASPVKASDQQMQVTWGQIKLNSGGNARLEFTTFDDSTQKNIDLSKVGIK